VTGGLALPCGGLLLDCDGVLVDSDASVDRAWSRWAHRYGLPADQVGAAVHGRRSEDTVRLLIAEHARDEALATIDRYEVEDAASVTAIPGAGDLLGPLPPWVWAVVTSGIRPLARARMAAAGLPDPPVLVTADDVTRGKPAPDGYLAAAALLGVPAGESIVLEDSAAGVAAARAAGVRLVVGVGRRALDTDAPVVVADLRGVRWSAGALRVAASGLLRST
jgi:sugar-phosphatase